MAGKAKLAARIPETCSTSQRERPGQTPCNGRRPDIACCTRQVPDSLVSFREPPTRVIGRTRLGLNPVYATLERGYERGAYLDQDARLGCRGVA